MKRLVIVGQPLTHSLSPAMHNAALSAMGLGKEYHYQILSLSQDELPRLIEGVQEHTIAGANITIPYKTEIMKFLSSITQESRTLGAVNTLYCSEGSIVGCNTDIIGFREALAEHGVRVPGMDVAILGAGGAARSVAYALANEGVSSLEILCRTKLKAEELAGMIQREFGVDVHCDCSPTADYASLNADLLVNCTPVGMQGHSAGDTPLKISLLKEDLIVMDLVYNPLRTRLLTEAQSIGCRTIGGVEMLVYQGAASLELWTGQKPPVTVMKQAVLDALGGARIVR